jgi:16S rRNA (guanine527-N7)-methyltransferase
LVDSIAKKLKVVEAVAEAIALTNITTQHVRAEEIRDKKIDFVVSRAVAPLKDLWKWSKPLLKKKPQHEIRNPKSDKLLTPDSRLPTHQSGLICLKGGDLAEEIQQSGLHPYITDIHAIFPENYFREKFILYNPL